MASQSQGIQQLLQAEKRAAEKVAEARKSEYSTARLRRASPLGVWWRESLARPGLAWPRAAASRPCGLALRAAGIPQPCPGSARGSVGPQDSSAGVSPPRLSALRGVGAAPGPSWQSPAQELGGSWLSAP